MRVFLLSFFIFGISCQNGLRVPVCQDSDNTDLPVSPGTFAAYFPAMNHELGVPEPEATFIRFGDAGAIDAFVKHKNAKRRLETMELIPVCSWDGQNFYMQMKDEGSYSLSRILVSENELSISGLSFRPTDLRRSGVPYYVLPQKENAFNVQGDLSRLVVDNRSLSRDELIDLALTGYMGMTLRRVPDSKALSTRLESLERVRLRPSLRVANR